MRYVDNRVIGNAINPNLSHPENTVYWNMQWKDPESIVYGHYFYDLKHPRIINIGPDVPYI